MIRVLIVDDQAIVCEGLRVILNAAPNIEVIGVTHSGADAVELTGSLKPDLVLMDLKMPGMTGSQATRIIREKYPDTAVLILTTYDDDEWIFEAIRAGAAGYLLKDSRRDDILRSIEETVAGQSPVDPTVATKLLAYVRSGPTPQPQITERLSEREHDVLRLLAHGLSNADIAEQLHLAEGTVRNYVSTILSKLDAADRTQAAALAWRYGLVSTNDIHPDED